MSFKNTCFIILLAAVTLDCGFGGLQKCTKHSDCSYKGGLCWELTECDYGICLCKTGYFPGDDADCVKAKKLGERCSTDSECIATSQMICQNGTCVCRDGGEFASEDNTSCHRRSSESCSGDDNCQAPLKCVNQKCNCPVNSTLVSYLVFQFILKERCIPNANATLKQGEECDRKNDFCDSDLSCTRCEKTVPAKCISGPVAMANTSLPESETSVATTSAAVTKLNETSDTVLTYRSGAEQILMINWVVGYLLLSATVIIA